MSIKVVLVGSVGAGKTSLVKCFQNTTFESKHIPTMGAQIHTVVVNDKKIKLWDCAGPGTFGGLGSGYYHDGQCAVIAVDLTTPFDSKQLETHVRECKSIMGTHIPIILCGTKSDSKIKQKTQEKLSLFSRQNNFTLIITSSKNNTNVKQLFEHILA